MKEEFKYILIRNDTTLKEKFELPLEDILNLNQKTSFLKNRREIDTIIENNISNFDDKYIIGSGTNLRINEINYHFPVLTTKKHTSLFFPELIEYNGNLIIEYHILKFKKVKIN